MALPLTACDIDNLLEVRDPERVTPAEVDNAESIPGLYNGALRSLFVAYSGAGDDSFLTSSAVLSDEMDDSDTFTTRIGADQRVLQQPSLGNMSDAAFGRFHLARVVARRTAAGVDRFGVGSDGTAGSANATFANLRAVEGYIYTTLAEGWCGALPFTRVPDTGVIDPINLEWGAPLTTAQTLDTATARFNEALARNPASNLAAVGKGRALLNANNPAAAAAAVAAVPTTYIFRIEHSANSAAQNNPVFSLIGNGRYGVADDEGGTERPDIRSTDAGWGTDEGEGVNFRSSLDPRVPWRAAGSGFTTTFRKFTDQRYPDYNADVPLASGVEARLIQAEAQLRAGNFSGAGGTLSILNSLRASANTLIPLLYPAIPDADKANFPQTLAPLVDPLTADAQIDMLFRERALWLYNTGHRLGDLRRLVRQYGRNQANVFPSGRFRPAGAVVQQFGDDVNFPVPFNEQNNPNYNPAQCVVEQA